MKNTEYFLSPIFTTEEGYDWQVKVYPKGKDAASQGLKFTGFRDYFFLFKTLKFQLIHILKVKFRCTLHVLMDHFSHCMENKLRSESLSKENLSKNGNAFSLRRGNLTLLLISYYNLILHFSPIFNFISI